MIDIASLTQTTKDRLYTLYNAVKDKVYEDSLCCNNWVRKQYFENSVTGFSEFVDSLSSAMSNNEISWYNEDEEIIDYCFSSLKLADFLYHV